MLEDAAVKKILEEYEALYDAREFRKAFIPLETISQNPRAYGLDRDPIQSNAKQGDFIADTRKVVAAICANRAGKTEAGVIKYLHYLNNLTMSGRTWALSESYDLQKAGIQEKIKLYLKPEQIEHTQDLSRGIIKQIDFKNRNGRLINLEFKTYEQGQRKLQSAKLVAALIDEEPPEEIYDEVYMRTVDLGGQVIMTFTPLKGLTWSYKRIFASRSERIGVYNWGMADNPFIPQVEIDELLRELTYKKAQMRLYGKYQGSENQIYYSFNRDLHVKPLAYDINQPVDVCIDWGVVVASVGFYQSLKVVSQNGPTRQIYHMIDAMELSGLGYGQIMMACLTRGYKIGRWYCDPAGRARTQGNKLGKSILVLVKEEYGIDFNYIPNAGVEEGIDIVQAHLLNAKNETRFFIKEGLYLDTKQGATPEMRIENYVRDDKTNEPIKDGINDHFCDQLRYYLTNKAREGKTQIRQH